MSYLSAREIEGPWLLSPQLQAEISLGAHTAPEFSASAAPSKGLSWCGLRACGSGHLSLPVPRPPSHKHPLPPSPIDIHKA